MVQILTDFKFNIYAGTSEEQDDTRSLEEGEAQEQTTVSSQPTNQRQFRPRTPESAKVGRGERGALVHKMVAELEAEILAANPDFTPERTVTTEETETDLQGVDPEIRSILNGFGIFFFAQIPSKIVTAYGPLLTRSGAQEDYQRLVEKSLLDDDVEFTQEKLSSQRILPT